MPHIVTRLTLHQRERHTVAIQPNVRCDYAGRMTNAVKSGSHARTRYGGRAIMLRRRNHHGLTWAHRLMWLCGLCASPAALHAAPVHGKPTDHERPASYTLVINLTPAVCAANPSLQKLRQCQEGFSLTVSSLRPELSGGRQNENCSQESAELPPYKSGLSSGSCPMSNCGIATGSGQGLAQACQRGLIFAPLPTMQGVCVCRQSLMQTVKWWCVTKSC
jgi:hypothetical protein